MALIQPSDPTEGTSLRQQVHSMLRDGILSGRYVAGSLLSENKLAEELRVSRTPVREAFRELAADGLVRILPKRGVMVTEMTIQDVANLYQLREALECFAARFAAEHMSDVHRDGFLADHAQAVAHLRANRLHDAYESSIQMHGRIYAMTRNVRLTEMMDQFSDQVRRLGMMTMRHGRSAQSIHEHGLIIDALVQADADRAERLMRDHIRGDRDVVLHEILQITIDPAQSKDAALPQRRIRPQKSVGRA
jgi:DNA-binding GntR family transcriptional regulator